MKCTQAPHTTHLERRVHARLREVPHGAEGLPRLRDRVVACRAHTAHGTRDALCQRGNTFAGERSCYSKDRGAAFRGRREGAPQRSCRPSGTPTLGKMRPGQSARRTRGARKSVWRRFVHPGVGDACGGWGYPFGVAQQSASSAPAGTTGSQGRAAAVRFVARLDNRRAEQPVDESRFAHVRLPDDADGDIVARAGRRRGRGGRRCCCCRRRRRCAVVRGGAEQVVLVTVGSSLAKRGARQTGQGMVVSVKQHHICKSMVMT